MNLFTPFLFLLLLNLPIQAELFIPPSCKGTDLIEQVILISDVDGVVRDSIEAIADPRVIESVQSLLKHDNVTVAFISGTAVDNDETLEPWRKGNVPLKKVFNRAFQQELLEGTVSIYGVSGGHQMTPEGGLAIIDEYSIQTSFELSSLLIQAFLSEVLSYGTLTQQMIASELEIELKNLMLLDLNQSTHITAHELSTLVSKIREHLDPEFRLINNGASVETHTSNPPWNASLSFKWLQKKLEESPLLSYLSPSQKQLATGFAKKGDQGFNYLLIGKINKGHTSKKYIEEKIKQFPNALIVTIGDTQIDFPMHQNAHLAFHVGLRKVWENNPLSHCIMVSGPNGKDSQHIEGTLQALNFLEKAIGKSFNELIDNISIFQTKNP